jgi:hypothetical protein
MAPPGSVTVQMESKGLLDNPVLANAQVGLAICAYATCSSTMLVINKLAVHFLPAPAIVLFFQLLSSAVVVFAADRAGLVKSEKLEWSKASSPLGSGDMPPVAATAREGVKRSELPKPIRAPRRPCLPTIWLLSGLHTAISNPMGAGSCTGCVLQGRPAPSSMHRGVDIYAAQPDVYCLLHPTVLSRVSAAG